MDVLRLKRSQVLAARLAGHGLDARLPAGSDLEVLRRLAVRVSGPGGALTALHARVAGVTPDALDRRLRDRSVIEVSTLRGARPVPVADLAVLSTGALPRGEDSLRSALRAPRRTTDAGLSASEAFELAVAAAGVALDGRRLSTGELSEAMTRRLPAGLSAACRACAATHVDNGLFRLVGAAGVWCRVATPAGVLHARTDQWLGRVVPEDDPGAARDELVRRVLRLHGPLQAEELAAWAVWAVADARSALDRLGDALVPVDVDGRACWAHHDDVAALRSPPPARGARLVPAYDELLIAPDRSTLVQDEAAQRALWRPTANPGVVLVGGAVVAAWRAVKRGRALAVTVTPLPGWPTRRQRTALARIEDEAAGVAELRDCDTAAVSLAAIENGGQYG